MEREQAKQIIERTGIFPGVRVGSADQALYAAETLFNAGIPVVEITMTVPGAVEVIRTLVQRLPAMAVGAGTVLDGETAMRCVDAGAQFVTSTGLVTEVVEVGRRANIVTIPGALTPSEVIAAWKTGADYVKIFPAAALGGELYIRSLKLPLPDVKIIATGGVNQQTALGFLRAGSAAIGVGMELLPREAVAKRQTHRIEELARRFLGYVAESRISVRK